MTQTEIGIVDFERANSILNKNTELLRTLKHEEIDFQFANSLLASDGVILSQEFSSIINFGQDLQKSGEELRTQPESVTTTIQSTGSDSTLNSILETIIKTEELPPFIRYQGINKLSNILKTYLRDKTEFRKIDLKTFLDLYFLEDSKVLKIPSNLFDNRAFFRKNSMPNQVMLAQQLAWILKCYNSDTALVEVSHRIGVISIDLNSLKEVNDFLGSDNGNQVISEIGYFLQTICERNGWYLASRSGGDEYDIIVEFSRGSQAKENSANLQQISQDLLEQVTNNLDVPDFIKKSGKSQSDLEKTVRQKLGQEKNLDEVYNNRFVFSFGIGYTLLSQVLNNYPLESLITNQSTIEKASSVILELAKVEAEVMLKIKKSEQKRAVVAKYPYMSTFFALREEVQHFDTAFSDKLNSLDIGLKTLNRQDKWSKYQTHTKFLSELAIEHYRKIEELGYNSLKVIQIEKELNKLIAISGVYLKHFGGQVRN